MEIIFIISAILLFVLTIAAPVTFLAKIDDIKWYHIIISIVMDVALFIGTIATIDKLTTKGKPEALDVYRGKTTLEITYIDSIPQDTVVVFKRKDK